MEHSISSYPNRANNKTGHLFNSTSFEKVAILVATSVSMTSNATKTNFVDTTIPKQQIIKNISGKNDVYMNNSKNTFIQQEVRQKDLESLEKIFDAHFEAMKVDIKRIEQHEQSLFDNLNKSIDNLKDSIKDVKDSVKDINKKESDIKIAKLSNKSKIWVAIIGLMGSIIGAIISAIGGALITKIFH